MRHALPLYRIVLSVLCCLALPSLSGCKAPECDFNGSICEGNQVRTCRENSDETVYSWDDCGSLICHQLPQYQWAACVESTTKASACRADDPLMYTCDQGDAVVCEWGYIVWRTPCGSTEVCIPGKPQCASNAQGDALPPDAGVSDMSMIDGAQ